MSERLEKELTKARKEQDAVEVRLSLAQAWVGFLNFAYDALQSHGINYRKLPEYTDDNALDEANAMPLTAARDRIMGWLERLQSAVHAAVRRKGFVVHQNDPKLLH